MIISIKAKQFCPPQIYPSLPNCLALLLDLKELILSSLYFHKFVLHHPHPAAPDLSKHEKTMSQFSVEMQSHIQLFWVNTDRKLVYSQYAMYENPLEIEQI